MFEMSTTAPSASMHARNVLVKSHVLPVNITGDAVCNSIAKYFAD